MTLADSDVISAHLRGLPAAAGWLERARSRGPVHISVITVTEISGDMKSAERRAAWRLLSSLQQEPVTGQVARRAGELMRRYRRSHSGIGLGDYLIAATAEINGLRLATLNVRHFPMFSGLEAPFGVG